MGKIRVEVALAFRYRQKLVEVLVPSGISVQAAIEQSNIFSSFDEVPEPLRNLEYGVGLFGKEIKDIDSYALQDGDRLEIYRPLLLNPQQARLKRVEKSAQKQKNKKQGENLLSGELFHRNSF